MGIFKEHITDFKSNIRSSGIQSPPCVGFKLTDNGNYDIQNKRPVNIKDAINPQDCINKRVMDRTVLYNRPQKGKQ